MIVRIRPAPRDSYGDPVGEDDRKALYGFYVAPRTSSDVTGRGRDGTVEGLTVFGPRTDLIADSDLIEVNGVVYTIVGAVGDWESPFGSMSDGTSFALKRGQG